MRMPCLLYTSSLIQLHADSRKRERILAKKKATSSQVAEKAGVSQATVSMILNRRSNVSFSAETVEKVECAARELGYELPHRKNKSNTRKEKLIVVLCPTLTSPYSVSYTHLPIILKTSKGRITL